jgi:hypothetical protein
LRFGRGHPPGHGAGSSPKSASRVIGQSGGIGNGGWPLIVSGVARNAPAQSAAKSILRRMEGVNASAASSRNLRASARRCGTWWDNGHASALGMWISKDVGVVIAYRTILSCRMMQVWQLQIIKPGWFYNHFFHHLSLHSQLQLLEQVAKQITVA